MSVPGVVLLERGMLKANYHGDIWTIAGGAEDDVIPIDVATWGSRTDFIFAPSADRLITGFGALGMFDPPSGSQAGNLHPYGRKFVTLNPTFDRFGLTLRHDTTSAGQNRLFMHDLKDLVLYEGDSFEMINTFIQSNGWHIERVSRNLNPYEPAAVVLSGNVNDYFPTGWRRADQINIGADQDGRIISGFRALVSPLNTEQWLGHKYKKRIFNQTAFNVVYAHDDTGNESVDAQRIFTFSGADVTAEPGNIIMVEYDQDADSGVGKWRLDA